MTISAATPAPPAAEAFEIHQHVPGDPLAGIVARMTGYRERFAGHARQLEPASLALPLVIGFGEAFRIGLGRTPDEGDRISSFAGGLYAGPVVIDSFGRAACLQIDFTLLGARRFFHLPMHELAERLVDLEDLLGPGGMRFREALGNAPDWQSRFAMAERFVLERIRRGPVLAPTIREAMLGIAAARGTVAVGRLAHRAGLSRRHLNQRFREEFGLGPKSLARIVRLGDALSAVRTTGAGLADIAADRGYADQAHMTREFRALAGRPPSAWRQGPL